MTKTYGSWTVLSSEKPINNRPPRWRCRCSCGRIKSIPVDWLESGQSRSCGCKTPYIDNPAHSRTYQSWASMKQRCLNPANDRYASYGGRGITIDPRWQESFTAFLEDMGPRPPGTSLDRIDNDGPYVPENCRWATPRQQYDNQRQTRTIAGVRASVSEHARAHGLSWDVLQSRLQRGWDPEEALTTPPLIGKRRGQRILADTPETTTSLAAQHHLTRHALDSRLRRGWSMERALNTPIQQHAKCG